MRAVQPMGRAPIQSVVGDNRSVEGKGFFGRGV